VGSAAQVLGLSPEQVQQQIAAAAPQPAGTTASSGASPRTARADSGAAAGRRSRTPTGARRSGAGGGGRYIVFAKRNGRPTPVWIRTGLTDLDYSEVLQGLQVGDSVYVLPSASLIESQQDLQQRINRVTGGGGVPGMRQETTTQQRSR
jgi:hypothetical protein